MIRIAAADQCFHQLHPNLLNQYASVNGTTYSYDPNGNLTSDGTYTYTYDAENRLLTATKPGLAATYAYDPLGRRVAKTGTGVTTTYFLSDGNDEIADYDGAGALVTRYVPGPTIDDPIAMVPASGSKSYFHENKQGSVIAMSGNSAALAEGPYTYDPYGNCVAGGSACSSGEPYRFTGRRIDPETGLSYYRARYYSSVLGRFLQTDPVGYTADLDLYTYVGNDPTDREDRLGLCDDVTGCSWQAQQQLNTPEARQGEAVAVSSVVTATGAYLAPERVGLGAAVGGVVALGVSGFHGDSPSQTISNVKAGVLSGATTSAGGVIGGKINGPTRIGLETTSAYVAAKAAGLSDEDAAKVAGVTGVVGGIFEYTPGLKPSEESATSATSTFMRSLFKSSISGEAKRELRSKNQDNSKFNQSDASPSRAAGDCGGIEICHTGGGWTVIP